MRTRLVAFPTIYIRGFQFSGPNDIVRAVKVVAGPSNSVVIDRQGMYWMTGKVSVVSIPEAYSLIDGLVFRYSSVEEHRRWLIGATLVNLPLLPRYDVRFHFGCMCHTVPDLNFVGVLRSRKQVVEA